MPFSFVPCQNYNGTIQCCKSLTHLTHLTKFHFWCLVCQMCHIIAFGTFKSSTVDALIKKKISYWFKFGDLFHMGP